MERISLGVREVNIDDDWVDFGGWLAETDELYVIILNTVCANPFEVYSSFRARITYEIDEGEPSAWLQEVRFLYDGLSSYFTFALPKNFPKKERLRVQVKRTSIYTEPRKLAIVQIGIDALSEKKFKGVVLASDSA